MADCLKVWKLGDGYGPRWVFRHLSFSLPPGKLLAILGPNGQGKSTLLASLAGLRTPREGHITWSQGPVARVPQSLTPTLPLTGLEMVLLGRSRGIGLFATPSRADHQAARAALARLNAGHLAERAFAVMSGGEKQLVLIARALASEAPVMLLDEPTAALDWHHQAKVLGLLRHLADEGLSILLTTHTPQHALEFADTVLLLESVTEHALGPPGEILQESRLSGLYGLPVHRVTLPGPGIDTAIPCLRHPLSPGFPLPAPPLLS